MSEINSFTNVRFIWDIHYRCNFRCAYCWFYNTWAKLSGINFYPSVDEWARAWSRIYGLYGSAYIEITGGEPLIYPSFIELIKELSLKHTIRITTNLSASLPFIERFAAETDNQAVGLEASFHPSFIGLAEFTRKAVLLRSKGFALRVQYVAYPAQLNLLKYFEKEFNGNGLKFSVTAFWGEYKGVDYPSGYNEQEREILRSYLNDSRRIELNLDHASPRGRLCRAGNRFALIRGDGHVVRCGQQQENNELGCFLDEGFRLWEDPLPCMSDSCPCNDLREA